MRSFTGLRSRARTRAIGLRRLAQPPMPNVIPSSIVASIFGYGDRSFFEAAEGTDQAPQAF